MPTDTLERLKKNRKKYRESKKGRYTEQKINAKRRGIRFFLTYEEWSAIWDRSGKWEQRGNKSGCFVMCRYGDTGAYTVDNVYIGLFNINLSDARNRSLLVRKKHTAKSTTVTFV